MEFSKALFFGRKYSNNSEIFNTNFTLQKYGEIVAKIFASQK